MPKARRDKENRLPVRGVNTEANLLDFPVDEYCSKSLNFELDFDPMCFRRTAGFSTTLPTSTNLGIQEEQSFDISTQNGVILSQACSMYLWERAGGSFGPNVLVIQTPETVRFYTLNSDESDINLLIQEGDLSQQVLTRDLLLESELTEDYITEPFEYTRARDSLLVVSPQIEPTLFDYDTASQTFRIRTLEINVRDTYGLDSGIDVDRRPQDSSEFTLEPNEDMILLSGGSTVNPHFTQTVDTPRTVSANQLWSTVEGLNIVGNGAVEAIISSTPNAQISTTTDTITITPDTGLNAIVTVSARISGRIPNPFGSPGDTINIERVTTFSVGFGDYSLNGLGISETHYYNLLNQGWYKGRKIFGVPGDDSDPVFNFRSNGLPQTNFPSNADIPYLGVEEDQGTLVFNAKGLFDLALGNSPAPRGHYIFNAFKIDRNRALESPEESGASNGGFIVVRDFQEVDKGGTI